MCLIQSTIWIEKLLKLPGIYFVSWDNCDTKIVIILLIKKMLSLNLCRLLSGSFKKWLLKKLFLKVKLQKYLGCMQYLTAFPFALIWLFLKYKKYKCTCTIFFSQTKVIMKEKLITVLCVHIESSFLRAAVLLNKNRCVSYKQNISLIFCVKYVRLWHRSCVYFTAQRQYTAVQKMCTPLK